MPLDQPPARLRRALSSLDGLSVGDAFGEQFFGSPDYVVPRIAERRLPSPPWRYTDDTEMAVALIEVLAEHGRVDQVALARAFVRRYVVDPDRGYGGGAHTILGQLRLGADWQEASHAAFDGQGSMGNGGAMRAAPLGAYFADDLETLVHEARASAEVTHAHSEGQAGAIAVAAAAAYAWLHRHRPKALGSTTLLGFAAARCPAGPTLAGLLAAQRLDPQAPVESAVRLLGNGSRVVAEDTVPFALWCAQRHLDDYVQALWTTVSGLGDRDTTCAIVGGIVSLSAKPPRAWVEAREPLRFEAAPPGQPRGLLSAAGDAVDAWLWSLRACTR